MAKFIDKKEQVFDFQLTPYGKYTLSTGAFKPVYYTLYDGEVLYDSQYAGLTGSGVQEQQNNIHTRIKENTAYIESLVCFDELETSPPNKSELIRKDMGDLRGELNDLVTDPLSGFDAEEIIDILEIAESTLSGDGTTLNYFPTDIEVRHEVPRKDIYRFGQPIGNARFSGPSQQSAPAWKYASLQGHISSSTRINLNHEEERIPQLNTKLVYKKLIHEPPKGVNPITVAETIASTPVFPDGHVISLVKDDLLGYIEEVNTELLTENFDIEVFQVETVPAVPAVGKIFLSVSTNQRFTETITINDGWTAMEGSEDAPIWRNSREVTFEFSSDGTAADADYVVVTIGSTTQETAENLVAAIESSRASGLLDVVPTFDIEARDVDDSYYVIMLQNKIVQRPWQWTNWEITETMTHGFTSGFESGSIELETLNKKYFERTNPQVVDGMMMYPEAPDTHMFGNNDPLNLTSASVEYYFDVLTDTQVDQKAACRGSELFNKDSYYIDLDFECDPTKACEDDEEVFYDIYGRAVEEPEICEPDDE
jgi:hypothetical protein